MAKNQVSTPAAPAAIGPYSQGITATGTAVYVSGQLPIDPATGAFAGDDITSQTRQSLENVKAVLAAAGYELSDVVKTTVLLKDIADFGAMNEVYTSYFTGVCPARSAFQVAALPKDARVEIEAIAVKSTQTNTVSFLTFPHRTKRTRLKREQVVNEKRGTLLWKRKAKN